MIDARLKIIFIGVSLFFIALVVKLFNIQVLQSEELKYKAEKQQTKLEVVRADRGIIYDRNNEALVYNENNVSYFLDLRMFKKEDKEKLAEKFSEVFGKTKKYYLDLIPDKGRIICLEKKIPSSKAALLGDFKVQGLFSEEDPTRVYPFNSLASHVIGYVNKELTGISGIESALNKELKGEDGERLVERNAIGNMISIAEDKTKEPITGSNVILTIDKNYQNILEDELKKGLKQFGGTSATGIIMDPNTGEVLALANEDDYDPNAYWNFSDSTRRNRAVTDVYEPGSTFKSFSMAALLDRKLVNEHEAVFCENGRYKYRNVTITDSHTEGTLTVKSVLEQSSNIGMSKLIQRLDAEEFYKYIRSFGFANTTSLNLPGEVKGMLKNPKDWTPITKAFLSFGYEITVTPIQLAAAYCALINGGILYQPQIIKKIVDNNGKVSFEFAPKKIREVISQRTSEKMREFLEGVVTDGTAKSAMLENVRTGGKTGTSQKLIKGSYSKQHYNSSFVGFFPVEKPKVVCLILVNSPSLGRYGGLVAAPIFKCVGDRIVGMNPAMFNKQNKIEDKKSEIKVIYASDNKTVKNGAKLNNSAGVRALSKTKVMPDLTSYSIRDAISILAENGIKYKVKGSGKIISQSIKAGTKLKKENLCVLECKDVPKRKVVLD